MEAKNLIFLLPTSGKLVQNPDTGVLYVSPFFSLDEAAQFLGIGVSAVRDLVRRGELVKRHTGQCPYHVDDLCHWVQFSKFKTELAAISPSGVNNFVATFN
jgi:hypothetical protein